jgi:predicted dehydrogenase
MLRVAIVGCGKIADAHATQIGRIAGCEIVGVCDREILMAQQLGARFPVGACFTDVREMIRAAAPHVVHITTPPDSHFELARLCMGFGCHVYVEKPFTLHADQTDRLIAIALERGLKLTAGHDDQFSHVARRMRRLVNDGYLGGRPVHMESTYCYDLADGYARALLGDRQHWVRQLPGKLLHNIISHGIARIAEFLSGDDPLVVAHGFISSRLKQRGEHEIVDELRVVITDEQGTTAYFTFSSQLKPTLHQFRIYGPRNSLLLDQDQETLVALRGGRLKSYGEKFVSPLQIAKQHVENVAANVRTFLARDFHMKSGMKYLIESFYRSITDGTPVPIPYREIALTSRIMDAIFDQLAADQTDSRSRSRFIA